MWPRRRLRRAICGAELPAEPVGLVLQLQFFGHDLGELGRELRRGLLQGLFARDRLRRLVLLDAKVLAQGAHLRLRVSELVARGLQAGVGGVELPVAVLALVAAVCQLALEDLQLLLRRAQLVRFSCLQAPQVKVLFRQLLLEGGHGHLDGVSLGASGGAVVGARAHQDRVVILRGTQLREHVLVLLTQQLKLSRCLVEQLLLRAQTAVFCRSVSLLLADGHGDGDAELVRRACPRAIGHQVTL